MSSARSRFRSKTRRSSSTRRFQLSSALPRYRRRGVSDHHALSDRDAALVRAIFALGWISTGLGLAALVALVCVVVLGSGPAMSTARGISVIAAIALIAGLIVVSVVQHALQRIPSSDSAQAHLPRHSRDGAPADVAALTESDGGAPTTAE